MKKFPSLRKFLLLKDGTFPISRSIHRDPFCAEDFVKLYDIAKASWEKYGDNGPPVGVNVEMLTAGHGGGAGVIRKFEGEHPRHREYFCVSREEIYFDMIEKKLSLVDKPFWWCAMRVVE